MDIHNPYLSNGAKPIFRAGNQNGCLCLHGFSAAPTEISWLGDHLHNTLGMTTYTPRLAGHGAQDISMARMRWADWYMSARDGYQLLADQCEQVFVAGISMGGLLALLLAAAEDIQTTAAAVLAAPTQFKNKDVYKARWLKHLRPFTYTPDQTNLPQVVREEQYRRGEAVTGRTHYSNWSVSAVAELVTLSEVATSHLHQVNLPLTLIYAEQDGAVPLGSMQQVARQVRSPVVEQHTLAHSGHIITQDIERDTAFQIVEQFFERYI